VSRLHAFDASFNQLELDHLGFSGCLAALSALMEGDPVCLASADADLPLLVAESLGNRKLCAHWRRRW
jgi:hypothetical protein